MTLVVTGSIATDHLMVFPGRFREHLIDGELDRVSLSFLVNHLDIRRGGVAANIAFGLGCLGLGPVLVGAVGADFVNEYQGWLDAHGVDTRFVRVSETRHTARFICTTDADHNQLASFYAGAMDEARDIALEGIVTSLPDFELVVVSPNDPLAMLRHTRECRELGYPFAADPSQQLPRMNGAELREMVDGASYLFVNAYERRLLEQKTGWAPEEVLKRVTTSVTTHGPKGVCVERQDEDPLFVPAPVEQQKADPTGVGDAFRAGFLAGVSWGVGDERAAQLGCMLATLVIETVGTQEYRFEGFIDRFGQAYGQDAAADIAVRLS